jgi:fused signal recognition particle receptor
MFRKLALVVTFLAFLTIVMGAYVRVSGAGLDCADWTHCLSLVEIGQQHADPSPADVKHAVDTNRARIAGAHRLMAVVLAIGILALTVLVWRLRERRASAVVLSLTALALVGLQARMGSWTVELHLLPAVVTAHLLLGYALLVVLYWLHQLTAPAGITPLRAGGGMRWLARLGLVVLLVELALGGWTSTNYAGLACPDFPTCLGLVWPDVDYRAGFSPGEALAGGNAQSASGRAAIHWVHRLGALASFLVLTALAFSISSNRRVAGLSKAGVWMSFWLLAEVSLGIAAVLFRLPVAVAVAHTAVAALLLLTVVHVNLRLRRTMPVMAGGAPLSIPTESPTVDGPPIFPTPRVETVPEPVPTAPPLGVFERLRSQLGKTRTGFTGALANLAIGRKAIDRELLDEIEEQLLMADLGVNATADIIKDLTASLERHELRDWEVLRERLRSHLLDILVPCSAPLEIPDHLRPYVILVVGVNGVGKTTTIGKIAKRLQNQGHSVMLAAGDTFRAAAVEQLEKWGERNQISVVSQRSGADSASVIYDAVESAKARSVDVLIADTAGRLHTKSNLMEELRKIKRIIGKLDPAAPHEVLLVLDAGTGQNAIAQTRQFNEAVGLTGLALTKLDGTAKGGVIFALAKQFGIPIRFIGIGEGIEDLQDFNARKFIAALFEEQVH